MTADTTTELIRGKGSYFGPGGKLEKEEAGAESSSPKDWIEKDLEYKVLTKELIDSNATEKRIKDQFIDITNRSHVGPSGFLVYKYLRNNMLYFFQRINPEGNSKKAEYKLLMRVPASDSLPP